MTGRGRRIHIRSHLAALVVFAMLLGCGSDIDLRFRPLAGTSRVVKTSTTESFTITAAGRTIDGTGTNTSAFTLEVTGVSPDGVADVKVTIEDISLGNQDVLSDLLGVTDSGARALNNVDLGLRGKSFTAKVNPKGQVTDVTGMAPAVEEATNRMVSATKKYLDGKRLPPQAMAAIAGSLSAIGPGIRRAFGDAAMQEGMAEAMDFYPDAPVRVGSTWTKQAGRSSGLSQPIKGTNTWKLLGRANGVLNIETTAQIVPNADAPATDLGVGTLRVDLTGQSKGTLDVEEATGWVIRGSSVAEVEGPLRFAIRGAQAPTGAQTPTMKVKSTTQIESFSK